MHVPTLGLIYRILSLAQQVTARNSSLWHCLTDFTVASFSAIGQNKYENKTEESMKMSNSWLHCVLILFGRTAGILPATTSFFQPFLEVALFSVSQFHGLARSLKFSTGEFLNAPPYNKLLNEIEVSVFRVLPLHQTKHKAQLRIRTALRSPEEVTHILSISNVFCQ